MIGWKPKSRDEKVASVRYRCLIPIRELQNADFSVELFDPSRESVYSSIVFSKCYEPGDQSLAEKLRARGGGVVLDLCDNHFYNPYGLPAYETARKNLLRMMSLSDLVTCSTPELAATVATEGRLAALPEVVGDPVEFADDHSRPTGWWSRAVLGLRPAPVRRLLWFGIHASPNAPCGMEDIRRVEDKLASVAGEFPFELVVCSNSAETYQAQIAPMAIRSSYVDYNRDTFPGLLREMNGVILPVNKNPFTWAKSHNRLTTSLFAGIPVIADAVPSYTEFSSFCYLDDWAGGLRQVLGNSDEARSKAEAGREYIRRHWMPWHVARRWHEVLGPLVGGRPVAPSALER